MGNEYEQRLAELEKQMAVLEHEVSDIKANQIERMVQMDALLSKCAGAIWGANGETGLRVEVDRLKQLDLGTRFSRMELKLAQWGGAIGIATITVPILVKIFWP